MSKNIGDTASDEVIMKSLWIVAAVTPDNRLGGKLLKKLCRKLRGWCARKSVEGKVITYKELVERVLKKLTMHRQVLIYSLDNILNSWGAEYLKQFQHAAGQIKLPPYVCLRKTNAGVYFTYRGHLLGTLELNYVRSEVALVLQVRSKDGTTIVYAMPIHQPAVDRCLEITKKFLQDNLIKYNVKLPPQGGQS